MSVDLVLYEPRPPAVVLTLNRPDRRNALSRGLIAALDEAVQRAGTDPECRCVILTGAGSVFCAGMDLAELQESLGKGGGESPVWDDALRLAPTHLIVGEVRTGAAALSLFRALMSDHAGLTTFHAEGPDEAVFRLGVILFADAQVKFEAARALFAQAIDLVVHVGWREGKRKALGVWEVAGQAGGGVKFATLWQPGDETLQPVTRRRE